MARLRWAGRLHDLGKIAVDGSVFASRASSTKRNGKQCVAILGSPRVSSVAFGSPGRIAGGRIPPRAPDGSGYYGIEPGKIPLAAHFLIVADSYDAMTSDRAYRNGLLQEHALAEIEKNLGTQFHTGVGKAFWPSSGRGPAGRPDPG